MPNWRKVITSGSDASLNTLTVSNGITGSLLGTASYAIQALSASYSLTSSYVNTLNQDVLINGSLNVTSSFTASGFNYPTIDGLEFQALQTNGAGSLSFGDVSTIYETIYNGEATTLTKGTIVYISGSQEASPKVYRANAYNPSKMPVSHVIPENIATASTGRGVVLGLMTAIDLTGLGPAGTQLYVNGLGLLTNVRPTGSTDIVQPIATITKEGHGGQMNVLNPGPVLLPNILSGSIWIGNGSNFPVAIATSSIQNVVSSSYSNTSSFASTASYVLNAVSASFAPSTPTFPFTGSAIITGSLNVIGNTTMTGSFGVSGNTRLNGNLVVTGSTTSTGEIIFGSGTSGIIRFGPTSGAIFAASTTTGTTLYPASANLVSFGDQQNGNPLMFRFFCNSTSTYGLSIGTGGLATARLHIVGGTAAASTAPLKLTAGTNLTTPEAGAIEFNGTNLFFTTGSTRSTILTSINPTSSTNINVQGLTIGKGRTGSLNNVYIHTSSISPNVTGTNNVGIGGATTGVTSGNYNIGVGFAAGVSATTATHNVFVGGFAGYLSNGSYNTFVGMETNYRAAGNYNVGVGFDCMFENTGTRNTGVGPQAGMYVATGNDNTYFGYNAGRYIAGGVTNSAMSSASVFLGVDSRPLASSQTNQIVIGYQAIGLGSNTVVIGNNSITTTALKGNTQVSGSLNVSGSTTVRGNTIITGSLLVSGSSLVAGITPIPLAGTIQDGVTSVLGSLNDWNSNFYQGTVLYSETAASTITFGQLCYRTQNETWDLADATAANSAAAYNMLGICVKSSTSTNPTSILINGFVETATYATIVKSGEPLYMATTPGSMTKTAPTTVGNAVRIIGNTFWDSNTNSKIIIHFNPDRSWIELT